MAARKRASRGTWILRALIAIVAGAGIGGAAGVAGVHKLEPGHPGQADSIQLMLDSLEAHRLSDPVTLRRAADSADAAQRAQRRADSTALANDPTAPLVPDVATLDEGSARNAISAAGLTVGTVEFRSDTTLAGTVLATKPVTGLKVRAGTPVTLILSDGRVPPTASTDTLAVSTASPHVP